MKLLHLQSWLALTAVSTHRSKSFGIASVGWDRKLPKSPYWDEKCINHNLTSLQPHLQVVENQHQLAIRQNDHLYAAVVVRQLSLSWLFGPCPSVVSGCAGVDPFALAITEECQEVSGIWSIRTNKWTYCKCMCTRRHDWILNQLARYRVNWAWFYRCRRKSQNPVRVVLDRHTVESKQTQSI